MKPRLVAFEEAGERLDRWLGRHHADLSRARLQQLVRDGHATVNGATRKPSYTVRAGDAIALNLPPPAPARMISSRKTRRQVMVPPRTRNVFTDVSSRMSSML